jgi:hypothetical protein
VAAPLKKRGKEIVLGVLLVAIVATVWRQFGSDSPAPSPAAGVRRAGPGGRGGADLAALKIVPVDWTALNAARPTYVVGRNIFQFGSIPAPTPPPLTEAEKQAIEAARAAAQKAQEEAARLAAGQAAQQAVEMQAQQQAIASLPPPKPQPPPIAYKFIGYIGPPEQKIAVLHDGTDMIFVHRGDVLAKQFKVLEIGYESIKFGYTDPQFKGESQTLPMSSSY